MPLPKAAAIMGVNPQFLRIALQQGKFPFGVAVKRKKWNYYINPEQFREYLRQPVGSKSFENPASMTVDLAEERKAQ
ncbi:hypothetical protein Psfp_04145 [Pelotomaculum sp. FP]|nr:hypothetical protein Psfp_04145 [Pelotomaculum sp. FP]